MSSGYVRSVVLRAAGALVSIALWLGLIVVALSNLDTGLPSQEGGAWPFFAAALVITVIVVLGLRRGDGGPGWGSFILGLLIPEVAFFINRLVTTEVSAVFWIVAALLILVPLPARKAVAAPG
jgi:hypothetical protein